MEINFSEYVLKQFQKTMIFFCVGVMYSGEYDVCDVTLLFAGIPKVVGSIPTVARHIFQACPVWIYTQSNITNINFRKNRTNLNNFSGYQVMAVTIFH
jgi:hypothetical protein